MPARFDLIITANYPDRTAEFCLLDKHGSQLAFRQMELKTIAVSRQQGLFDLRDYLRHYVESGNERASVAEIGVCIAEQVLGEEIFRKLWESEAQRTLRIELPGATEEENHLVAALARVPWELARRAADQPTLGERNLQVRVVHDRKAPATQPLDLADDECLRVLFVFAEAPGSGPLAARRERQQLRQLFEKEIYPKRRIVADFLTHGVTRERLKAQIDDRGGYHIIHWSGHGHLNLLELAKAGGGSDRLSGDQLLDLCGGFIPRLFFLSACHSGDILRVRDWNDFLAIAQGKEPGAKEPPAGNEKDIPLEEQPGYTGTAHALLRRGVSSVVAMRYAVGDEYARQLGIEFYRALLAHAKPKTAAAALTIARRSLLDPKKDDFARYDVCDHATPVLYGAEDHGLTLPPGRSPALGTRDPRLHRIAELTMAGHPHFVGRTWQLAGMGSDFIGASGGDEVKPVAVITGLGGMGKTALAAEALSLWESRFEWVLLYQAKPNTLGFDATLRDIHMKLNGELGRYHKQVKSRPADVIFRPADAQFTGAERLERLTRNLVRAMRDEPILLVLDNFEKNLKPQAETSTESGESVWSCQDPAWDRCLAMLATELVGTSSRVLITCRRPLAALDDTASHRVLLGPLPAGEAALYLRAHAELNKMIFSSDQGDKALAIRLLEASRFHPLLMDRLARLATGGPNLRPQLMKALQALETTHDYKELPELFAATPGAGAGDEKELAYLDDALATSLDGLIRDASPDARRLLWMIAVANDPVALGLLKGAWSGESFEQERLRQMKQLLDMLLTLPPELQEKLKALPPELRARVEAVPPEAPARPELTPLLGHLVAVGLVTAEHTDQDDENPDLTCHELVRERIGAWMEEQPQDRAELTQNGIRLAYAERLEAVFKGLQQKNMTNALQAGSRALVYCVQAEAWDRLGGFAGGVVTSATDPRVLTGLLPHLEAAADSAPEGEPRWSCLCYLADALRNAGRPDASLPFYKQAATQARTAAKSGGENGRRAWSDLAWITGNWASALLMTGDLDTSRQRHLDSAEASREAGRPTIHVIGRELEALRIDIMQGKTAEALPQVETRLAKVQGWWDEHRSGEVVPDAPDPVFLARAFISALDIADAADRAQNDWESALRRTDAVLEVKRALERPAADIASSRVNRAVELGVLGRFGQAKAELEACLQVFQNDPAKSATILSSLAALFDEEGDGAQAIIQERRALALREQLPDPSDRAISHNNLAVSLGRRGSPPDLAESLCHQLADLVYCFVAGLGESLRTSLDNYAIDFRRAQSKGIPLTVPRVAELLADPAFHPLADWLRQRGADVTEVQADVDQALETAQRMSNESK